MVCFVPPLLPGYGVHPPHVCIEMCLVVLLAVDFWVRGLVVGKWVCGVLSLACWLGGWLVDVWVGFVRELGVCTCAVACGVG